MTIKRGDKAIFHKSDRPVFTHTLCGFTHNPNDELYRLDGNIVSVVRIVEAEYSQCDECGSIFHIEEQYKKFNILVLFCDEDYTTLFCVSDSELEKLEGVFDD